MTAAASSSKPLTGYYRYTDVWFEWSKMIPDEANWGPLKAMLAHDSLCHPDHPLRQEGVNGVSLFLGTFHNGQSRLLFSSKQVDYVRYWLHANGITPDIIPLPYANCLLDSSQLKHVSPSVYETGGSLRNAIKNIEKNNKRLKKSAAMIDHREVFERSRTCLSEKKGVWCAVDFEAWDRDHTLIIEFGWSMLSWKNGAQIRTNGHLIVKENQNYHQTFVAEHRRDFKFGGSQVLSMAAFKKKIHNLFTELRSYGPVFLVFHDSSQDIRYLKSLEVPLDDLNLSLPGASPSTGIFVVDTVILFAALEGESFNNRSLEKVTRHLQIPTEFLHNAGNDAHYTLLAALSMAEGDTVDAQREKRWPNQTGTATERGLKVQFTPYQEDSDHFSEEEDEDFI